MQTLIAPINAETTLNKEVFSPPFNVKNADHVTIATTRASHTAGSSTVKAYLAGEENDNTYYLYSGGSAIDSTQDPSHQQSVTLTLPSGAATTTASKAGVFNGGFETAPSFTAATTTTGNWIDGTATGSATNDSYGWSYIVVAGTGSAQFDDSTSHSGKYSLKLSTTNATGKVLVSPYQANTPSLEQISKRGAPIKASTKYKLSLWAKGSGLVASSGLCVGIEYDSTGAEIAATTHTITMATGAFGWTKYETVFTTALTAVWLGIRVLINEAGDAQVLNIDELNLEEIVTDLTASKTSTAQILPTFTSVTSTDSIDQAQLTTNAESGLGVTNQTYRAQSFIPTKKYLTSVSTYKGVSGGTYAGDITVSIRPDSGSTTPSATILASTVISNAAWTALATGAEIVSNVPCIVTPGNSYWIVLQSSTTDGTNIARYKASSTNTYANGKSMVSADGSSWSNSTNVDHKFKTTYAKKTESFGIQYNNQKLELNSNADGILSGAIISIPNGTYSYTSTAADAIGNRLADVLSTTAASGFLTTTAGNYTLSNAVMIWKVNTLLPISGLTITARVANAAGSEVITLALSADNSSYADLAASVAGADTLISGTTASMDGQTTFYLKATQSGGGATDLTTITINAGLVTTGYTSFPQFKALTPILLNESNVANTNAQTETRGDSLVLRSNTTNSVSLSTVSALKNMVVSCLNTTDGSTTTKIAIDYLDDEDWSWREF